MIGSEPHPSQSNSTLSTLKSSWPLLLVLIIWALQVAGSWLWLKANATPLMGWDAVGHLWRTVLYRDILAQLSPVTLFQAFALDSFRPPLFHLCAVVMYRLFGTTADVAVATSFPFLLLLLLAVYGIGHCCVIVLAGTSTELVQKYLNWNEKSKGAIILKKACGILVLLGGVYLIYTAS